MTSLLLILAAATGPGPADSLRTVILERISRDSGATVAVFLSDPVSTLLVAVHPPVKNSFGSIADGSPYALDRNGDGDTTGYGSIGKRLPLRQLAHRDDRALQQSRHQPADRAARRHPGGPQDGVDHRDLARRGAGLSRRRHAEYTLMILSRGIPEQGRGMALQADIARIAHAAILEARARKPGRTP